MKIHNVTQGSPEWHALRAQHFNASEAPAMMGVSKYQTRTELLTLKKTGITPEVTSSQQYRFDQGHKTEELARPIVEAKIGEELYPIVGTEGNLLASVDGATMLVDTLFEHKLWNESLVAQVQSGELTPQYYWQLEQQLLVTGAARVLFVCSDGTEDNFVSMEYRAVPGRVEQLLAGWKQFENDLADYTPAAAVVEAVGKAPDAMPALRIEVTGMVTASNLDQFKARSAAVLEGINTDLQTDQHFADAEKTVRWCGEVEERLAEARRNALSQTESIDLLFRTIEEVTADVRAKRLELEKLVKARKISIREDIVLNAAKALQAHIDQINDSLDSGVRMPKVTADFAGVIKGKRTISSLRDAADSELASAKINASQIADRIRLNLRSLMTLAADYMSLFHDVQMLVMKENDDLVALIKVRISEHKEAEAKKEQETRNRIQQEEQERLTAESAPTLVQAASAPTGTAAPMKTYAPAQSKPQPAASTSKCVTYQAEISDFDALVRAIVAGNAPWSLIKVDWEALDALVAQQGSTFSMPGVNLVQVAA